MAAKPRTAIYIGIVAIVIALIASISLYRYLKTQEEEVRRAVATQKIVVARGDISAGSFLEKPKLSTVDWPRASLPQGSFTSPDDAKGRLALDRFTAGEPIVEAKLVPLGGVGGILTYKIPEGHRAITVGVDQVAGVAGFISPGNMVDVVLTTGTARGVTVSKIVLQNIPVLATGQIMGEQQGGAPVVVPTVTLDVTPEDAEKLAIASNQGRLQLVLRSAGDKSLAETQGATITQVMRGTKGKKKPARRRFVKKKVVAEKPVEKPIVEPKVVKAVVKEAVKEKIVSVEVWKNNVLVIQTFKEKDL
jgi:pilus assembly protein CpaB